MPRVKIKIDSLRLGWKIKDTYIFDGFFGMITEGKQRVGKSSYNMQSMAYAFGQWDYEERVDGYTHAFCVKPDFERVKEWVVFPPRDFLNLILSIPIGTKEMCVYWSDAGFWLFVLDWYEPFVKSVAKYIQLCGRQFGSVLFSTPSKRLISGKVLESMPDIYVCKVVKASYDTQKNRPRIAKAYERWDYPDGKKGGVKNRWRDKFNAILPDDFWAWYKPISDRYLEIGRDLLKREVARLTGKEDKKEKEEKMEIVHKAVGDPERLKEINEVLALYTTETP